MPDPAPHKHIGDGSYAGVRWFVERPPDLAPPLVLVTLQSWDTAGNLQTARAELRLPATDRRAWLIGLVDTFLCQIEAADAERARRAAKARAG